METEDRGGLDEQKHQRGKKAGLRLRFLRKVCFGFLNDHEKQKQHDSDSALGYNNTDKDKPSTYLLELISIINTPMFCAQPYVAFDTYFVIRNYLT